MFILSVVCVSWSGVPDWMASVCCCRRNPEWFWYSRTGISVSYKLTCLKCQLGLYLPVISILEKNVTSLKNGKVIKLYLGILYALLPCDNCFNAVFQWCMPRGGFCPQEKETAHSFLLSLSSTQWTKAGGGIRGWELQYSCMLCTQEKNIPSVKCSCRSLKTFSEDLNLLFRHSRSCFFFPPLPKVGCLKSHVLCSL